MCAISPGLFWIVDHEKLIMSSEIWHFPTMNTSTRICCECCKTRESQLNKRLENDHQTTVNRKSSPVRSTINYASCLLAVMLLMSPLNGLLPFCSFLIYLFYSLISFQFSDVAKAQQTRPHSVDCDHVFTPEEQENVRFHTVKLN